MSKGFYRQLAKTNMKKNGKIYTPYILSVIAAVAMFYIIQSLALNPGFENMLGFDTMNSILIFACWVVRIFLVIFMLYTNSFLIKQRRKEFGVYHMLGFREKTSGDHLILGELKCTCDRTFRRNSFWHAFG